MSVPQPYAPFERQRSDGSYEWREVEYLTHGEAREWWRWHFAGRFEAAEIAGTGRYRMDTPEDMAKTAARRADLLISELERKP